MTKKIFFSNLTFIVSTFFLSIVLSFNLLGCKKEESAKITSYSSTSANHQSVTGINDFLFQDAGDGTYQLLQYSGSEVNVVVPSNYQGHLVTLISSNSLDPVFPTSVQSITLPNTLVTIGGGVFSGCKDFTKLDIPNSVRNIVEDAFFNCGIKNITIPASVVNVGKYIIDGCNLDRVVILNSKIGDYELASSAFDSVNISNNVTSIGSWAFQGSTGFKNIVIPSSVTTIGDYAFKNCSSLENVVINDGVPSLPNFIFENCTHLQSVVVPPTVTAFWNGAFEGCSAIKTLIIRATNPPRIYGNNVFDGIASNVQIKVPAFALQNYKNNPEWKGLADKIVAY